MKAIMSAMALGLITIIGGCGTTIGTETSLNGLQLEGYPSFAVERPIKDRIEIVVPIGNGTMLETVRIETVTGGGKKEVNNVETTTNWDIDFNQEQITTTLNNFIELSIDSKTLSYELDEELIADAKGEKISYQADIKGFDSELSSEMLAEFNELQPKWITARYHLDKTGMLVRSGDQIQPSAIRKYLLRDVIGDELYSKIEIPEIVEGYGTYEDTPVIITSYSINENLDDQGSTVQIKGKGYNLYDAKWHVQLRGEFQMLLTLTEKNQEILKMTAQIKQKSTDYNVGAAIRGK